jgi:hypothetical protein
MTFMITTFSMMKFILGNAYFILKLNVVIQNVSMLSVVAPFSSFTNFYKAKAKYRGLYHKTYYGRNLQFPL